MVESSLTPGPVRLSARFATASRLLLVAVVGGALFFAAYQSRIGSQFGWQTPEIRDADSAPLKILLPEKLQIGMALLGAGPVDVASAVAGEVLGKSATSVPYSGIHRRVGNPLRAAPANLR